MDLSDFDTYLSSVLAGASAEGDVVLEAECERLRHFLESGPASGEEGRGGTSSDRLSMDDALRHLGQSIDALASRRVAVPSLDIAAQALSTLRRCSTDSDAAALAGTGAAHAAGPQSAIAGIFAGLEHQEGAQFSENASHERYLVHRDGDAVPAVWVDVAPPLPGSRAGAPGDADGRRARLRESWVRCAEELCFALDRGMSIPARGGAEYDRRARFALLMCGLVGPGPAYVRFAAHTVRKLSAYVGYHSARASSSTTDPSGARGTSATPAASRAVNGTGGAVIRPVSVGKLRLLAAEILEELKSDAIVLAHGFERAIPLRDACAELYLGAARRVLPAAIVSAGMLSFDARLEVLGTALDFERRFLALFSDLFPLADPPRRPLGDLGALALFVVNGARERVGDVCALAVLREQRSLAAASRRSQSVAVAPALPLRVVRAVTDYEAEDLSRTSGATSASDVAVTPVSASPTTVPKSIHDVSAHLDSVLAVLLHLVPHEAPRIAEGLADALPQILDHLEELLNTSEDMGLRAIAVACAGAYHLSKKAAAYEEAALCGLGLDMAAADASAAADAAPAAARAAGPGARMGAPSTWGTCIGQIDDLVAASLPRAVRRQSTLVALASTAGSSMAVWAGDASHTRGAGRCTPGIAWLCAQIAAGQAASPGDPDLDVAIAASVASEVGHAVLASLLATREVPASRVDVVRQDICAVVAMLRSTAVLAAGGTTGPAAASPKARAVARCGMRGAIHRRGGLPSAANELDRLATAFIGALFAVTAPAPEIAGFLDAASRGRARFDLNGVPAAALRAEYWRRRGVQRAAAGVDPFSPRKTPRGESSRGKSPRTGDRRGHGTGRRDDDADLVSPRMPRPSRDRPSSSGARGQSRDLTDGARHSLNNAGDRASRGGASTTAASAGSPAQATSSKSGSLDRRRLYARVSPVRSSAPPQAQSYTSLAQASKRHASSSSNRKNGSRKVENQDGSGGTAHGSRTRGTHRGTTARIAIDHDHDHDRGHGDGSNWDAGLDGLAERAIPGSGGWPDLASPMCISPTLFNAFVRLNPWSSEAQVAPALDKFRAAHGMKKE